MEFPGAICVCMCELGRCWGNCMSICIDKCSYGRERSRCDCQSMTHACANVAHPRWKGFCTAAFSSGERLTNYTHNIHLLLPKLEREIDRQWELVLRGRDWVTHNTASMDVNYTMHQKKNHVKTSSLSEKLSWEICNWKREPLKWYGVKSQMVPNDIGPPPNLQKVWGHKVFLKLEINNFIQQGCIKLNKSDKAIYNDFYFK